MLADTKTQFILSGIISSGFIFPQNPVDMSILGPRSSNSIVGIIRSENIYMRPLLDNDVRIMRWDRVDKAMFDSLRPYADPDANGDLEVLYFWDGQVNEFAGTAVKVISVWGEPLLNEVGVFSMQLQLRPVR